jgi:hypothetical protein
MENCTVQYRQYHRTIGSNAACPAFELPGRLDSVPFRDSMDINSRSRDKRVVCAYLTRISDQIGQVGLWASSSSEEHPSLVLSVLSPLLISPLPSAALSSNESTDGLAGLIALLNKHFGLPAFTDAFLLHLTHSSLRRHLLLHSPSQKQKCLNLTLTYFLLHLCY